MIEHVRVLRSNLWFAERKTSEHERQRIINRLGAKLKYEASIMVQFKARLVGDVGVSRQEDVLDR